MKVNSAFSAISARVFPSFSLLKLSAFSARIIALRIENPYSILRQIANLPQPMMKVDGKSAFSAISARVFPSFSLHIRVFSCFSMCYN